VPLSSSLVTFEKGRNCVEWDATIRTVRFSVQARRRPKASGQLTALVCVASGRNAAVGRVAIRAAELPPTGPAPISCERSFLLGRSDQLRLADAPA
jgi:hypothetical protein